MTNNVKKIDAMAKQFIGSSIEELVQKHLEGKTDFEIVREGQQAIKEREAEEKLRTMFGK